jgi:ParB family chromosome partitioning protein
MSDEHTRKRLGRGLAALIGEMDKPESQDQPLPVSSADDRLSIELIGRSPNNPRRSFSDDELEELAASIREHGLIQPIVVRPAPGRKDGVTHEIVAGERRWRAAQRAGKTDVPVIIRDVDDRAALELAIIENVQRADLNAVEEAMGYQQLIDEHGYTQSDLGQVIGKSRSHVANTLRLLKLPDPVRNMIAGGDLSAGHARTLVTSDDPEALARRIVAEGLSVRQAETLAQNGSSSGSAKSAGRASSGREKDADTLSLEKTLSDALGYRVQIDHKGPGGRVTVHYKTLEQLDGICHRLQDA